MVITKPQINDKIVDIRRKLSVAKEWNTLTRSGSTMPYEMYQQLRTAEDELKILRKTIEKEYTFYRRD
jgi:hypothetical protein